MSWITKAPSPAPFVAYIVIPDASTGHANPDILNRLIKSNQLLKIATASAQGKFALHPNYKLI